MSRAGVAVFDGHVLQGQARRSESHLLAAVSDDRLQGREDAIYFVLRGLGVPVSSSGQAAPYIVVGLAEMPTLFHTLRRMGLPNRGPYITLAPRPSTGASSRGLERRVSSAPSLPGIAGNAEPHRGRVASSGCAEFVDKTASSDLGMSAVDRRNMPSWRSRSPDVENQSAVFDRLALPKHAAKKHPFLMALLEASKQDVVSPPEVCDLDAGPHLQVKPGRRPAEYSVRFSEVHTRHSDTHDAGDLGTFLPKSPRADPAQQRSSAKRLAEPRRPIERFVPPSLRPREQSAFGRAAHRDLCERLCRVRAPKPVFGAPETESEAHAASDAKG
mmetsp:Transcript_52478/g.147308  ORF Transcript_52478/g.147308 Transcript_52478/m.147308 type:complete len:329 (-) Transcript_52478:23-1009(-)